MLWENTIQVLSPAIDHSPLSAFEVDRLAAHELFIATLSYHRCFSWSGGIISICHVSGLCFPEPPAVHSEDFPFFMVMDLGIPSMICSRLAILKESSSSGGGDYRIPQFCTSRMFQTLSYESFLLSQILKVGQK
ncbi:hypothetical protein Tco_0257660 [Tanacetum coccineum]